MPRCKDDIQIIEILYIFKNKKYILVPLNQSGRFYQRQEDILKFLHTDIRDHNTQHEILWTSTNLVIHANGTSHYCYINKCHV